MRLPTAALLLFAAASTQAYTPETPVTVPLTTQPYGTEDQPDGAFGLGNGLAPDQLKISIGGERTIYVSWFIGQAQNVPANSTQGKPSLPDPNSYSPEVHFGFHSGSEINHYEFEVIECEKKSYFQDYSGFTSVNTTGNPKYYYASQLLIHCPLKGLKPKTTYYYRAGSHKQGYSEEYSFTTPPATGQNFPVRLGVVADVGNTLNSTATLQHLAANKPDFFTIIGDLVYADRYSAAGVVNILNGVTMGKTNQTYQPKWDEFGRQLSSVANVASVPVNVLAGNHEIERDDAGNTFQAIFNRFRTPFEQAGSTSSQYYSYNYGGVHIIMLGAYEGPSPGPGGFPNGNYPQTTISATQLAWFKADLAAVDRSKTPWVIVQMHPPFYNSYVSHYKEDECLQQQLEDVWYNAGVDLILYGHVHAYERTNRVYKYQIDGCGPVHITMGDGGNIEYNKRQFADECGGNLTPRPTDCNDLSGAPQFVGTGQVTGPNTTYCQTFQSYPGYPAGFYPNPANASQFYIQRQQPPWSAYREPSFGHSIIEFTSNTEATISWFRNQGTDAEASDSYVVTRDPTCPNQKGGFGPPPAKEPEHEDPVRHVTNAIDRLLDGHAFAANDTTSGHE